MPDDAATFLRDLKGGDPDTSETFLRDLDRSKPSGGDTAASFLSALGGGGLSIAQVRSRIFGAAASAPRVDETHFAREMVASERGGDEESASRFSDPDTQKVYERIMGIRDKKVENPLIGLPG